MTLKKDVVGEAVSITSHGNVKKKRLFYLDKPKNPSQSLMTGSVQNQQLVTKYKYHPKTGWLATLPQKQDITASGGYLSIYVYLTRDQ